MGPAWSQEYNRPLLDRMGQNLPNRVVPFFLLRHQYMEVEKNVGKERGREKEGEREDGQ